MARTQGFLARMVSGIGASHGRLLVIDPSIASAHTGHGIVMPQCNHGGPGRAGAGEELGGLYGLRFYHQRLAVQGSTELLASLQGRRRRCIDRWQNDGIRCTAARGQCRERELRMADLKACARRRFAGCRPTSPAATLFSKARPLRPR